MNLSNYFPKQDYRSFVLYVPKLASVINISIPFGTNPPAWMTASNSAVYLSLIGIQTGTLSGKNQNSLLLQCPQSLTATGDILGIMTPGLREGRIDQYSYILDKTIMLRVQEGGTDLSINFLDEKTLSSVSIQSDVYFNFVLSSRT